MERKRGDSGRQRDDLESQRIDSVRRCVNPGKVKP